MEKEKKNYQQQQERDQRRLGRQERQLNNYKIQLEKQEQQITNHVKHTTQRQQQPQQQHVQPQQQAETPVFEVNDNVPLYPGSHKTIRKELMKKLENKWKKKPKQIVRVLLIDFVGKDKLKLMTRIGKNNKQPIPDNCIAEIKGE